MVLVWTNPVGLCLLLHLLVGLKSQIQFKTKFNPVPIKEPKKISASSLSFVDQASQFRSAFFQKRKPKLSPLSQFKIEKFPSGEEPFSAAGTQEIPSSSSVTEREDNEVSDVLVDETSAEASAVVTTTVRAADSFHEDEEKSSSANVSNSEPTTDIVLDGSVKTAALPGTSSTVKSNKRFLNENLRNLFQRPRSSLLPSYRGKKTSLTTKLSSSITSSEVPSNTTGPTKKDDIIHVPSSSVAEDIRPTTVLLEKVPLLDKVSQTPDVELSSNKEKKTEAGLNKSFNASHLSGSTTQVKARHRNEYLDLSHRQRSSLLASFSRGKTGIVSRASSQKPPRIAVQEVSDSVEEDIIVEMMEDVLLDALKQADANGSRQDPGYK